MDAESEIETGSRGPATPLPIEVEFAVRSYELDSLGHLNNAVYFSWLEEATFSALGERGLPFRDFAGHGWIPVVVHAQIDFQAELRSGDRVLVHGWVRRYGTTSLTLAYRLTRRGDDVVAATGERVWVIVDDARQKLPVPELLRRALGPAEEA